MSSDSSGAPQLSVVIPTFNERDNLPLLIQALDRVLTGIAWEAIVVDDDSRDGTADIAHRLAQTDRRIRCIERIGRRGLSSACIEGMMASSAPFVAVIDADLQHDESLLARMFTTLRDSDLDIVVGSRYVEGGGTGDWQKSRLRVSQFATWLGQHALRIDLADPMSGFFMLRRSFMKQVVHRLSGKGFKILLDIFVSADRPVKSRELPYTMRPRSLGDSKLDTLVVLEYLQVLLDKGIGRFVPVRFMLFVLVGCLGALLHLGVLGMLLNGMGVAFGPAQALTTLVAMTANFLVNNVFTYRDRRLRGTRLLMGLLSFYLVCGIGAFINYRVAVYLFDLHAAWWLAGLIGAVIGAVWNYAASSTMTWPMARTAKT